MQSKQEKSEWQNTRYNYEYALEIVCKFVQHNVIKLRGCFFLDFLKNIYQNELEKIYGDEKSNFATRYLEEKLEEKFKRNISIRELNNKKIVMPYGYKLLSQDFDNLKKEDIVKRAAFIIRNEIVKIAPNKLPANLTVKDLIKGECDIPNILTSFYSFLLIGTHNRRPSGSYTERLTKSFVQDAIYAVSSSRIKTSKHVTLGLAIKALTNSRKIINVINKFGHCCSYSMLEGLETEMAFS